MGQIAYSTEHIGYLTKDFLDEPDEKVELSTDIIFYPSNLQFLKITGMTRFWDIDKQRIIPLRRLMEEVFSGFHEGQIPLIFAIFGRSDKTELFFGTYNSPQVSGEPLKTVDMEMIKDTVKSAFQGISFEKCGVDSIQKLIEPLSKWCLMTGSPSEKVLENKIEFEQIERLIRGLHGRDWGYVVIAYPLKNYEINILYNSILNEMRILADSVESSKVGAGPPIANEYLVILTALLSKFTSAKVNGLWHTAIYLHGSDEDTLTHVKGVAKSVFGGRHSSPDRIRTLPLHQKLSFPALLLTRSPASPGSFNYPFKYMNLTNSSDLSCFVHLPTQEVPGFEIKPYSQFHVSFKSGNGETVTVGDILDQGINLGIPYRIPLKELNKHGLVVGTTGSGKTNTLFYLIKEFWNKKIPFLVIEPVKTEYRKILLDKDIGKHLQVFTLGNNNISPFRINPFEVIPGMPVQTHIELLKSVFNASFVMWGPLPHVLERCIHEMYTDKGWDLTSNSNPRGHDLNANPTLSDLFNKVDEVVDRLGYSEETTMEIRGALKTRINSMRIGGKGLMLDTKRTISFETLMKRPTILELEAIGDDEEKCFIMGIILTRMYEEYISKGLTEKKDLTHITIIEEAHRLLGNYHAENPNVANVKGKAVETFTNILAEIRAYGEGFIIAEQIPTKLAPEIVKNTNLKVMHRIVADDDRNIMAATMNIDRNESVAVTSLQSGHAVVYSEGDWGAYEIKVPYSKIEGGAEKDDAMVVKAMDFLRQDRTQLAPFEGCVKYCSSICRYKPLGTVIAEKRTFSSQLPYLFLALTENTDNLQTILSQMFEIGTDEGKLMNDAKGVGICSLIHGGEYYSEWLGTRYQWSFDAVEKMKDLYLEFAINALQGYLHDTEHFSGDILDQNKIIAFMNYYHDICKGKQPTTFCHQICSDDLCLYRFYLFEMLADTNYTKSFISTVNEGGDNMWEKLASLCREAVTEIAMPTGTEETLRKLTLCYALQKAYSLPSLSRRHIKILMENLLEQTTPEPTTINPENEHLNEGGA